MPPASANCALILRALPQYALTWSPANPALMMNVTAAELGPQRDKSANNEGTLAVPGQTARHAGAPRQDCSDQPLPAADLGSRLSTFAAPCLVVRCARTSGDAVGSAASVLDVFHQAFWPDFRPINVSLRIRGDALGRARAGRPLHRIRNEPCHDAVADSSNSDAALPTVVVLGYRFRFRIGDIDHVLLVDEDTAWAAELEPLVDVVSVLVENLDAVVLTIANEEASARIHRQRVRDIEFARARAFLPPGLDELAVLGEFYDPRIGVAPVAVGDKNVAIGRDQNCRRRIEFVRAVAGDPGLAEPHQHPAVRTKLEDLVALSVLAEPVGDPDIPVAVHMQPMRKQEQSLAKGLHQRA